MIPAMAEAAIRLPKERRPRDATRAASRVAILDAARRVATRDGARDLSLRGVAAEAGFAPAALYGYFRNKDELLLALAADDLTSMARAMRDSPIGGGLAGAGAAALAVLSNAETMAAASAALTGAPAGGKVNDAERLFNGRMIAVLKALSDASGLPSSSRENQSDVVLIAAALTGLALLARSGRLSALGFTPEEIIARLDTRFKV
ncbi:MAG: transcriptional regulator, TetR family [Alphaproteobacteria bacterium]|nr:transcriptional regulator, TetR family [Alphaproteobacteria bacterium]